MVCCTVRSHKSATFRGGGDHFCGRVTRLATRQGLLRLPQPVPLLIHTSIALRRDTLKNDSWRDTLHDFGVVHCSTARMLAQGDGTATEVALSRGTRYPCWASWPSPQLPPSPPEVALSRGTATGGALSWETATGGRATRAGEGGVCISIAPSLRMKGKGARCGRRHLRSSRSTFQSAGGGGEGDVRGTGAEGSECD